MVPTELTREPAAVSSVRSASGAVIGLTALGIADSRLVDPALAGIDPSARDSHRQPRRRGRDRSRTTRASSASRSYWVLLRLPRRAASVAMPATSIVTALIAASTIPGGLELGPLARATARPTSRQLPFEWTALALAVQRLGRRSLRSPHHLASWRALAAVIPHTADLRGLPGDLGPLPHRRGHRLDTALVTTESPWWLIRPDAYHLGFCTGPGRVASRSHAPFPSLRSVPLGRLAGAAGISSTNRLPQGGIT